jgi:hypothetical protein
MLYWGYKLVIVLGVLILFCLSRQINAVSLPSMVFRVDLRLTYEVLFVKADHFLDLDRTAALLLLDYETRRWDLLERFMLRSLRTVQKVSLESQS